MSLIKEQKREGTVGVDLVSALIAEGEKYLAPYFKHIDKIEETNFSKVLKAFTDNRVGEEHFSWVTGYGHDDLGRAKIDQIFAQIFKTEAAIVRPHFVSGTHAISCCLFGCLRPGDELISVAGEPYDTLHKIIGITDSNGSLKEFGISYKEVPLKNNFEVDIDAIPKHISPKTKMVFIQRSKGYHWRQSLTISEIEKIILIVKKSIKILFVLLITALENLLKIKNLQMLELILPVVR